MAVAAPASAPASFALDDFLRAGFAFVPASQMLPLLQAAGSLADWDDFANSWHHLHPDRYMADQGRYRKRRHGVYRAVYGGAAADGLVMERQPHQPHYQSTDYNSLNGGIERWFEPIDPTIGAGQSLTTILRFCHQLFGGIDPAVPDWHVEVHQFRIEAAAEMLGKPTPEGVHRDGVDHVLVLMINRINIASGTTQVHAIVDQQAGQGAAPSSALSSASDSSKPLGSFTLTQPFDAALVEDRRVMHGVTPVTPLDPTQPAYRDVLVVTFRAV
ncbi:MAG: hypothetical protein FJX22_04895 [Alphaproteobacteria bacterium]|nr:hypothetical protein [Alphaproteobacteria bacterium]